MLSESFSIIIARAFNTRYDLTIIPWLMHKGYIQSLHDGIATSGIRRADVFDLWIPPKRFAQWLLSHPSTTQLRVLGLFKWSCIHLTTCSPLNEDLWNQVIVVLLERCDGLFVPSAALLQQEDLDVVCSCTYRRERLSYVLWQSLWQQMLSIGGESFIAPAGHLIHVKSATCAANHFYWGRKTTWQAKRNVYLHVYDM